ncbi:DUF6171 family protein [Paenibacillus puerhi]|uniref:DUF6171 family protein n=1 Tax=Paenibacillus puerhi TaxID=2692622 RepID=UPI0013581C75|nr:DUF6171 family protein [Paenibacillus puerhi]
MPDDTLCKGCRPEHQVTDAQMVRVLASPAFAPERRVPEPVYQARLELCRACPKLQGGTTCAVCGCLIPVSAWLKQRSCPLPGGGRWQAED